MPPVRIDVESTRAPYQVLIGRGLLEDLAGHLGTPAAAGGTIVVSCSPVWRRHGARLRKIVGRQTPMLIPDGERAKTLATVEKIYDAMIRRRLDRSATLVAFGGGVVGDV